MNSAEAILAMNEKGSQKDPFLFIIDYEMDHCEVISAQEAYFSNILFNFNGTRNYHYEQVIVSEISLEPSPIPFDVYEKSFEYIRKQLNLGYSYLVNLTFQTPLKTKHTLSDIFHSARAKYRLLYNDKFVVFSPETFVKISEGKISTYPMKGTIDASTPGALETIMNNRKEMAEHATIVDLLRNDLSRVATNVRVASYRYAEEIKTKDKTLIQVSSEIVGELPSDYHSHLGDILFAMLPAGSVTGAPKKKTVEIIENAENYERGLYTGIAGYFDGENLDSCVLIRFIENENGQLFYKSGGGITSQSDVTEEYQELIDKIYVPVS
jgi:para-aminobenzoate synthetase component I